MENTAANFDMFNWDAIKAKVGEDPFADKKKYEKDERFYTLPKDEKGSGVAIIRLLPDINSNTIIKVFKINTTFVKNGKKRFYNGFSPTTIGLKCPFQDKWAELYNSGKQEEAKAWARTTRFICNIKVIKDPLKPENEGKIFLYDMSSSLKSKIQDALEPSTTDMALGAKPKQMFNPLKGNSIKLVAKIGANGQTNYDSTEVIAEESSIYNSVEEAIDEIKTKTYNLQEELLSPDKYPSFEELLDKLSYVTFANESGEIRSAKDDNPAPSVASVASVAPVAPVAQTQAAPTQASNELDDLLKGLM